MKIESFNVPTEVPSKAEPVAAEMPVAKAFLIAEGVLMEFTLGSRAYSTSAADAAFDSAVRRWRRSVRMGAFQAAA